MARKMLIDAAHPEETRVVVVNGNRIEEFDFEAAAKKPLKGNIYLAKVTRVEPSLQAAFVDFGGNRHGFLAFNEIHPDYYQIPVADRQRLIAQDQAAERRTARDEADGDEADNGAGSEIDAERDTQRSTERDADAEEMAEESEASSEGMPELMDSGSGDGESRTDDDPSGGDNSSPSPTSEITETPAGGIVESVGEVVVPVAAGGAGDDLDDALEEARGRRSQHQGRPYKIHEVIKRRQILLVQVVKEERGTKGAALTTYLSLAGRYCVLMPNTARGGGISRKITNQPDRKRLKSAVAELDIPPGIGLIIRTAGAQRTKAEIKRDYEYLLRVWENVRDLTLKSTAPALVYEEGNLIKRALRDLYSKEIEEILVDGDEGYKDAKAFMRTLMPSHAKAVQPYKDRTPLFQRFQIESMLDQMFHPIVHLRSGGYIVINQTEALVAIDVNSGRATREHSIEDTAYRTNLEAVEEIARQLRLRDLAGLIVIDLIDMEEGRNNRAVEKRLKDGLKNDRARIQVGRISTFGLLEMSRQRLRAGLMEGSTNRCPHCEGSGIIRSVESAALRALRAMEEEGLRDRTAVMTVRVPPNVALYILNHKRADILEIEQRYGTSCLIEADEKLTAASLVVERTQNKEPGQTRPQQQAIRFETAQPEDEDFVPEDEEERESEGESEGEGEEDAVAAESEESGEKAAESAEGDDAGRKRRRRRRRRGRRDEPRGEESRETGASSPVSARAESDRAESEPGDEEDEDEPGEERSQSALDRPGAGGNGNGDGAARRKRRRGRRGGRRNRERTEGPREDRPTPQDNELSADAGTPSFEDQPFEARSYEPPVRDHQPADERDTPPAHTHEPEAEPVASPPVPAFVSEPTASLRVAAGAQEAPVTETHAPEPRPAATREPEPAAQPIESDTPSGPPRRGWWQRRFGN